MIKILLTIIQVGIVIVPLFLGILLVFRSSASYEEAHQNSKAASWGISRSRYALLMRLLGVLLLCVSAFAAYSLFFEQEQKVDDEVRDFWKDIEDKSKDAFPKAAMLLGAAIAIPTRMSSTRFPGKPLAKLGSKTVIEHVYERCMKSELAERAVILTDSPQIMDFAKQMGAEAIMTSPQCSSGTERIIEAFDEIGAEFVVNVQGDEPFISPNLIDALIQKRAETSCDLVTAASRISDVAALENENVVKVLRAENGRAIYFSRSPLPFIRGVRERAKWLEKAAYWRHIGIYGYSREALNLYANFGPCALEKCEMLEQLRFISNGMQFEVVQTQYESIGIDTPADLVAAEEFLKRQS